MMSGVTGTSRANSRSSKDKTAKTNASQNSKTDGPPSKMQATAEQIRLAQMIPDKSGADEELEQKIQQLAGLTGKAEDDIAIALHDCENDLNRAYLMLMEGENDQGEWKESGKKKKRQPAAAQKGSDSSAFNHTGESKPERSEPHQRGRGDRDGDRERDRDKDGPEYSRTESSSRRGRRDTRPPRLSRGRGRDRGGDRGGDLMWRDNDQENDRKPEEGGGGGGGRERGRGRGRGVNGAGRRGGRGGGGGRGGETARNFRSPRYEKGPQIDTWTNETAENAEKENQVMWADSMGSEDWNDDSWTGSLTETKVFTSTSIQGGPAGTEPVDQPPPQGLTDTANTIPHNNSLPQRLDIGALLQKPANDVGVVSRVTESQFISQYNKEATESIKNSIGIGSSSRPNLEPAQNSTVNQLASLGSSLSALQQTGRLPATQPVIPAVSLQQRPKPQKSKLPPPSKIPASAVEMPGHMATSLDVQFGNLEFGADSFSIGGSDGVGGNSYTVSTTAPVSGAPGLTNHLDQVTSPEASLSAMRGGSTPNKSAGIPGLDQTSPRGSMFPSASYATTPTKKEINSPEPIPFPSSQSDLKTSPLVSSQRPGQATNSLQGSLSSNNADSSGLYGQSSGYQSSNYKSSAMNSTQNYTHSSGTLSQSAQYPNSLASQTSQNQYQGSQNQYQATQNQYPNYQSGAAFQSQTGFPSQSNQNSLYQSVTSTGTFQNQSYPSRDSQSAGSFQTSVSQSTGSSYALDSQTSGSFPRDSQTSNSYQRESQPSVTSYQRDSQPSVTSYQRDSQAGGSAYQSPQTGPFPRDGQSGSPYTRDSQSSSTYARDSQPSTYQRDGQSSSVAYTRDGQSGSSYQREAQSASSSYPRDSQSGGYPRDSGSGSGYSRDGQSTSTYHRDSQSAGSGYGRDGQSSSSTNYPRESSHAGSSYGQQTYSSSNHQTLQTSPLTAGKLSDSLSKMTVKDSAVDNHQVTQHSYEHTSSSTTSGLTTTTSTASSSLANVSTGSGSSITVTTSANISSSKTNVSSSSTSKGPPNLPPGVPLLNAQYIMNMSQGGIPPYFSLQQQPLYPGYEELQLLQQRGVPLGSYYDMSSFGAPTTMAGRDQTTLGNVPYTGADGKLNRVEAQSPVPTTQPQQSQNAHQQPYINPTLHPGYGYYPYPSMLPGAGFQYPHTMFMPPVTNTAAHGGSTGTNQYQKAYGSHSYGGGKGRGGYDDLSQPQDFSKGYGGVGPSQAKVSGSVSSVSSGSGSATDLAGYSKSHAQVNAFDKQGFHAATPNSFSLPMSSGTQGGPMAPTTPYHQYMPMIPPHSMLHHPLQQDSSSTGRGSQPSSTQPKSGGSKPYANYWGAN